MRVSLWPGPHNGWEELLALALRAEALGFDGLWLADHLMPNRPDPSDPVNEAWTTLAGLAARVPRIRIGTLVCAVTLRHPALLAKMAAGVDRVSGGRLVLGLGAAWQENEHRAYGIPFPPLRERLERLEEACVLIRSLLTQERTSFAGRHYQLVDAPCEPKPVQRPLPLLIGGSGERVTLRIAARHADEWNTWGTPEVLRHKNAVLDGHAEAAGRDPAAIARSAVALVELVKDPDAARNRRQASGPPVLTGSAEQLAATLRAYADAGVSEFVLPDFNLGRGAQRDEAIERFLREVAAAAR
jgi:F420-dependent oxidoreductase-like protein